MIRVVGLETGKLYAQGTRADCFRRLQEKYPYSTQEGRNRRVINEKVYPEPLKIEEVE